MPGTRINDLSALSEPTVRTDRHFVGRSGELYRADLSALRGGILRRPSSPVLVKPTSSDFSTWVNQSTASLTDVGYALRAASAHQGTTARFNAAVRSIPSGNFDVMIGCRRRWFCKSIIFGGLVLRESATSKAETFMFMNRGLITSRWTSATVYSADRTSQFEFHHDVWFRVKKANGRLEWYFSLDGVVWCHWENTNLTDFFTTAPDQWGIMISAVNTGTPNNDVTLDVFHWAEGANLDVHPLTPTYGNPQGTGNRTSDITVTTTATISSGTMDNLVDGGFNNDATDAVLLNNAQSGRSITFQFPNAKIVTEAKWFQNAAQSNGTWKWQGSNDGSSFTDLSATFTLDDATAGAGGTVIGDLSANTTAYLYYRMLQTAGTTSNAQRLKEIEFKLRRG